MNINFEGRLKKALENAHNLKAPACPDDTTIGFYIEGGLSEGERIKVETHTGSCLYCLARLVELKELIYFQRKGGSLSPKALQEIEALGTPRKKEAEKTSFSLNGSFAGIAQLLLFPIRQWRYSTVGIMSACIAVIIALALAGPEKSLRGLPKIDPNAFAQVKALDARGEVLSESQGFIISKDGFVASDLSSMVGANSVTLTLRDGRSFNIKHLWKDENRNLAILKVEGEVLPHFAVAGTRKISVGQKAFIIADHSQSSLKKMGSNFQTRQIQGEVVISDFKSYSERRGTRSTRYIQLASLSARFTKGAIVDSEGRLLGIVVTGEKNLSLAAPLDEASKLVEGKSPLPVSNLEVTTVYTDALNPYFRGILARDAGAQDEAIELFKKAVQLNPNLEAAHLELGFIYYRKRLFDLERKAYEEALRINPDNADTLFYLATNMETTGHYDDAARVFERVVMLDPEDADAWYELGLAYLAQGERAKALKAYTALKITDPGLAEKLRRIIGKE